MEQVECACGCGKLRDKFDTDGRRRHFIKGHHHRVKTKAQREAWLKSLEKRPKIPWNKGKTYTHASKKVYANKGSWNKAMRRLYADKCMRCGWSEASCDTHHIDPKNNGGKFSIENGIILCPNCHRLADFGLLGIDALKFIKSRAVMMGVAI